MSRKELFREGVTLAKTMRCWWLQFQGKENNGQWYDGERRVGNTTIRFSWLPKLANYFKAVQRKPPSRQKQAGGAPKKRGGRRRKLIPAVLTKKEDVLDLPFPLS